MKTDRRILYSWFPHILHSGLKDGAANFDELKLFSIQLIKDGQF